VYVACATDSQRELHSALHGILVWRCQLRSKGAAQLAAWHPCVALSAPFRQSLSVPQLQADDMKREQERLMEKLDSGLVNGVWLQMGSDLAKLKDGIQFLQSEVSRRKMCRPPEFFGALLMLRPVPALQQRTAGGAHVYESHVALRAHPSVRPSA
jgi:hypothetical protein